MKYQYTACSKIGKRPCNEDAFYTPESIAKNHIFMVCDGMGGHGNGDLAAQFVIKNLANRLANNSLISEEMLLQNVHTVHKELHAFGKSAGNSKMGTTLAMVAFNENNAHVVWVGDSRVYHIRNGRVNFKTTDHSLLEEMRKNGSISPQEEAHFPLKNIVLQAMGAINGAIKPGVHSIKNVQPDDVFLVVSDGFLEAWSEATLVRKLSKNPKQKFQEICQVCEEKAKDNFTAILITATN